MGFSPSPTGFLGLAVLAAVPPLLLTGVGRGREISFNKDVRPILADKCFACHGPDAGAREGDLRLDTHAGALADRGGYAAVIPGNVEGSEMGYRIRADRLDRMPPVDWHKALTEDEKKVLELWIEQGAKWEEHWAFLAPMRASVPAIEHPFAATPVDAFVFEKLTKQGLSPSAEADPQTLLRRLSLDLIGLPPTTEEMSVFLNDAKPGAYERQVDRLLASPHFGERMAMGWLDLVRFADTVGYHGDQIHNVVPYRDWVIHAINENMPFDEFTRLQLAGDLVEGAGDDGLIASCYNRLLQTSHEGGVQLKEYAAIYDADRVRNFGSVWLGLTVGCAQCHDHKFDPIEQKDFYQFAAFFADIDDRGHLRQDSGRNTLPTPREPEMDLFSPLDRIVIAAMDEKIEAAEEDELKAALVTEREAMKPRRVMVSRPSEPRTIRVLGRGNWMDETGEVVEPNVPKILPAIAKQGERATRLELANWLMDSKHPLTARVFVNRLWRQFFGRGISKVLDDLGSQGAWPDYPKLLDWLAVEFREGGWNVKAMVKLLVTTNTYRQISIPSEQQLKNDPDNQWFGRQNRWRLEAEIIRDQALFHGGLLSSKLGGVSGLPYQPVGYYIHLNFPKRKYKAGAGEQQYRRGVYTHWQRTFLHPSMLAFDAPTREECTAERVISNTPSAALALLNDPTFVEAACALAHRSLLEAGDSDQSRLAWAFRKATGREASPQEVSVLGDLLQKHRNFFESNKNDAEALLAVGNFDFSANLDKAELAAWTSVARALLNLHETVTRS